MKWNSMRTIVVLGVALGCAGCTSKQCAAQERPSEEEASKDDGTPEERADTPEEGSNAQKAQPAGESVELARASGLRPVDAPPAFRVVVGPETLQVDNVRAVRRAVDGQVSGFEELSAQEIRSRYLVDRADLGPTGDSEGENLRIAPLLEALQEGVEKRKAFVVQAGGEYEPRVELRVDRETSYRRVKRVVYTAYQAGFSEYLFRAMSGDDGGAGFFSMRPRSMKCLGVGQMDAQLAPCVRSVVMLHPKGVDVSVDRAQKNADDPSDTCAYSEKAGRGRMVDITAVGGTDAMGDSVGTLGSSGPEGDAESEQKKSGGSKEKPTWAGKVVVPAGGACPSVPRSDGEWRLETLHELLGAVASGESACRSVRVDAAEKMTWAQVAPVYSIVAGGKREAVFAFEPVDEPNCESTVAPGEVTLGDESAD